MVCVNTEIRLECLKLAVQSSPSNLDEAMGRAKQFVDFVAAESPAATETKSEEPKRRGRPPKDRENP